MSGRDQRGVGVPGQFHRQQWWQRLMQKVPASSAGAWLFSRMMHRIDTPLLRLSKGRVSVPAILSGVPVITLTTTGAKSGKQRTVPVLGFTDEEKVVVIASNWGRSFHPGWYYNLRANPEAAVSIRGRGGMYVAREATEAERENYWQIAVEIYQGFPVYQRRAAERRIPVMVLTPKTG